MKLASLKGPSRDGTLCVVDRALARAVKVDGIAPTMQHALDNWPQVEAKLRDAMRAGSLQPLSSKDLNEAIKRHKPTVRDWFQTARNHALYANQSGLYDDILAYMKISK